MVSAGHELEEWPLRARATNSHKRRQSGNSTSGVGYFGYFAALSERE
jgi:hypothetical protein